eukprot:CAMPEP_0179003584 /NCGR_PEP_ID=MMETSP0795-20121207/12785_1 /TAXON_ID=88552 /ORGANISM="Amoebophrya sp., Strain Ameob2" /LENGTH=60 /DNA_ID=CAMNT_0020697661 /DNA_START=155 /DNA_END=337 /DNA_ORIENTATION=+
MIDHLDGCKTFRAPAAREPDKVQLEKKESSTSQGTAGDPIGNFDPDDEQRTRTEDFWIDF